MFAKISACVIAAAVVLGTASTFGLLTSGCSAMSAVSSGVQTGTGAVQQGQSTTDAAKGGLDGAKNLAGGDKKKDGPDAEGPGDDDDRLHAKDAEINTPLNDKVDFKKLDKEDWRKFQLQGKPGVATFELFWDNEKAELEVDVFDAYGVNVGRSPPRLDGQSVKRILVSVQKPSLFYVRVRAVGEKDRSIYTLNVKWAGPPVAIAANPPQKRNDPPNPPPQKTDPPPGPTTPPSILNDPNRLQASIISAYRDGNGWVLYLDKGSSQKVRQGQSGVILEGADGDKLVDKGDFTISQVVDGEKCIARTNLPKPPGKNKRVLITVH
jgi:hypothetical protein